MYVLPLLLLWVMDTYTIEYETFVPVLTKAIQEMSAQIDDLKKQIEELKNDKMRD